MKSKHRRHRRCPPHVCWRSLAFSLGAVLVFGAAAHAEPIALESKSGPWPICKMLNPYAYHHPPCVIISNTGDGITDGRYFYKCGLPGESGANCGIRKWPPEQILTE